MNWGYQQRREKENERKTRFKDIKEEEQQTVEVSDDIMKYSKQVIDWQLNYI